MTNPETAFFITDGGVVARFDIPDQGTDARRLFDEKLAKSELRPLDADQVTKVEDADPFDGSVTTSYRLK